MTEEKLLTIIPSLEEIRENPDSLFVTEVMRSDDEVLSRVTQENHECFIEAVRVTALSCEIGSDYTFIREAAAAVWHEICQKQILCLLTEWRDLDMMRKMTKDNWRELFAVQTSDRMTRMESS